MADDITLPGTGTVVATDQVGSSHYQLIKLAFGPLDTATLVTASVGLPVAVVGSVALAAGSAVIGHVVVDSGTVAAVTAITNALPAGTNLLGKVSSGLDTSTINNGTTALTPKFAAIGASSSGNTTVVAAVTGKKIRVLSYRFQADADVSVKFRDNTAGVDLTGAMASGAKGGGGGAAFSPVGHFETASGNALSINLSGAVAVGGHLAYLEV